VYLSYLLVNIGDNPDRVDWQRTRAWLRNLYRVHQRLCMAFPDKDKALVGATEAARFAAYCEPFSPNSLHLTDAGWQSPDIHQKRDEGMGFLYRIDYPVLGSVRRPVIVVQSANRPDWDHAFGLNRGSGEKPVKLATGTPAKGNADFLLAAPPMVRKIEYALNDDKLLLRAWPECRYEAEEANLSPLDYPPTIMKDDEIQFILRANVVETRPGKDGKKGRHRLRIDEKIMNKGDRAQIEHARYEEHYKWLQKKLADAAEVTSPLASGPRPAEERDSDCDKAATQGANQPCPLMIETGWAHASRGRHDPADAGKSAEERKGMQWWAVTYRGRLKVKDPAKLKELLVNGIGPAKAFGFGLLSVARA